MRVQTWISGQKIRVASGFFLLDTECQWRLRFSQHPGWHLGLLNVHRQLLHCLTFNGREVYILKIKVKKKKKSSGSTSCRLQIEDDNEEEEFKQRGLKLLMPTVPITVRCGFIVVSDWSSGRMQLPRWFKVPSYLLLRALIPSSSPVEKPWMINYPK